MARVALLIGVSEYGPGLRPLPAASKDIEALQSVLSKDEIGNFDDVRSVFNPSQGEMAEAIETWAARHQPDDLMLLYFSGYRIYDENQNLYFAARSTYKNQNDQLVKASAVPVSFVRECLEQSRSTQQIIILDWCLGESNIGESDLFEHNGHSASLESQLGAVGRVVLTPSTNLYYSFAQKRAEHSLYTYYLVEAMKTGVADQDHNGLLSVHELHEYVSRKVKEAVPNVQPKIIGLNEQDFHLAIANVNLADPRRKYRQEVEHYASSGNISAVGRSILDTYQVRLNLSHDDATAIEEEVLRPYLEYQTYLQQYRDAVAAIEHEYLLNDETHNKLRSLQRILGLRDEDVAPIQAEMTAKVEMYQRESKHRERLNNLQRYGETFAAIAQGEYPPNPKTQNELKALKQLLKLQDEDVAPIEEEIRSQLMAQQEAHNRKLEHYEFEFAKALALGLPISEFTRDGLQKFQNSLELSDEDVERIEWRLLERAKVEEEAHQQKLQHYEFEFSQEVERELPLSEVTREKLKKFQHHLGLRDDEIAPVEQRIVSKIREQEEAYQRKLQRYEQRFTQIADLEFPIGEFARHELDNLKKSLALREPDVQQIEKAILFPREARLRQQLEQQRQDEAARQQAQAQQETEAKLEAMQEEAPPPTPPTSEPPQPPTTDQDDLASEQGIDYTRLRDLLQASRWREADEETLAVMLRATGREKEGWLDQNAIANFPCADLNTIDQLWMKHSGGQFGFSAQYQIYTTSGKQDVAVFSDRVGWWSKKLKMFLYYNKLTFNPQAPQAHLPALWFWKIPAKEALRSWGIGAGRGGCATDHWMLASLMARLGICKMP